MVYYKFADFIKYLVTCNGTGDEELKNRVAAGEVTEYEANLIRFYVTAKKLNNKLDAVAAKIPAN